MCLLSEGCDYLRLHLLLMHTLYIARTSCLVASSLYEPVILQVLHLTLPFNQEFVPVCGVGPVRNSGRPDTCLVETLSPGLRNSLLQNDVDSGVMAHHRDRVTSHNEFEWLVATGGVVSL